jgi:hypothetical protein
VCWGPLLGPAVLPRQVCSRFARPASRASHHRPARPATQAHTGMTPLLMCRSTAILPQHGTTCAQGRVILPHTMLAFTRAPCFNRLVTTNKLPCSQAMCSGVAPMTWRRGEEKKGATGANGTVSKQANHDASAGCVFVTQQFGSWGPRLGVGSCPQCQRPH